MFLTKPVSELTCEDVEALTLSGEPEGIMLDYKKMISGSERDKTELAKDICAFANSQGGYMVIGVEEKHGKPVHPPCGTERLLERQKAEEWVEQVANSNIAQRVVMDIRSIAIPNSELCVIVVHVPMSTRMPHMVTCQRDNRYYRRIFKRHQYESLPAEEYEVREMFEKASRMVDRTAAYLSSQAYGDPSSNEFAENTFTKRLGLIIRRGGGTRNEIVQAGHYATFVACPNVLADDLIETSKDELWNWLDPNSRRYSPDLGAIFLPTNKVTTLEGIVLMCEKYHTTDARTEFSGGFLRINRNGYIELGCSLAAQKEDDIAFAFVPMMGLFWRFLGFVTDLYRLERMHMPFKVILNMKGTEDSLLHNLGEGWLEPYGGGRSFRPTCLEPNIQIIKELRSATVDEDHIAEIVREVAQLVDNAWGQREARCYNRPDLDPDRQLPISQMRGVFP